MLEVSVSSTFRDALGGEPSIAMDARTIRELLTRLGERYPAFEVHLREGVAVSINGEIFRDDWRQPIPEGAEVHLLPRIAGG